MTARPATVDLVFVSDLHLGAYDAMASPHDQAFGEFLTAVTHAQARRRAPWRLVILGDLFDFPAAAPRRTRRDTGAPARRATAVLDRAERCAPASTAALRQLLRTGIGVDVVAGNHDFELMHADVQRAVAERLDAPGDGRLTFHPWIYHVPGLVHAEHGSQHHDINRVGGLLGQADRLATGGARTPAAVLGRLHRARERGTISAAAVGMALPVLAASALLATATSDSARARATYAAQFLEEYSAVVGLPAQVLRELDAVSSSGTFSAVGRVARRVLALGDAAGHLDYMSRSASRVHAVLASHGLGTPFYVFGHTHEARRAVISSATTPTGEGPLYLNTGTWSPFTRGCEAAAHGQNHPTWVHIDAAARRARLRRWPVDQL
ncbi:metallophosphoesterase family protein [Georgenia ruanii]|uniref:hypothetical protein n=1 Tax=Georgenia ruanii TaxID=348442 RepID=UPI00186B39FB|nr:hypothetical protein [Georgenia ruanii]